MEPGDGVAANRAAVFESERGVKVLVDSAGIVPAALCAASDAAKAPGRIVSRWLSTFPQTAA